jgi:hypothetical protein
MRAGGMYLMHTMKVVTMRLFGGLAMHGNADRHPT